MAQTTTAPTYTYDPERITYFASTDARGSRVAFGIKAKDRQRHMYVIGKTGMGKSTLLENLAIQDIQNGEGLCFIDPHGSTASKLLDYVPEHRIKDVIYFAPFDMDYPLGFNVMEDVGYDKRHLVVAGLMSAFKRIWVDAWSSRMEYILQNTLLALLEYPDTTLIDINRMLSHKGFRKKVVAAVSDPIVKRFWEEEFANYTDRYVQEATPAIQNKIGQFTSNPLVRNIIGQPQSTFDIRKAMDERKILIVNLSKGRMGEQNADLLGSILTTKIYLAAMGRAEVSAEELKRLPPFYFYVDEFQSVANDSFANILSEARKYKLALTIAHQYIEQVEENIRAAVFGNVGTTIAFRVGPFDAEVLKTVFEPTFTAEDLVNLGFAQIYLTLMIDGIGSQPFSARTLPPLDEPPFSYRNEIIRHSQETFGRPRAEVEAQLREVATRAGDQAIAQAAQNQNKPKNQKNANAQKQNKQSKQTQKQNQQSASQQNKKDARAAAPATRAPEHKQTSTKANQQQAQGVSDDDSASAQSERKPKTTTQTNKQKAAKKQTQSPQSNAKPAPKTQKNLQLRQALLGLVQQEKKPPVGSEEPVARRQGQADPSPEALREKLKSLRSQLAARSEPLAAPSRSKQQSPTKQKQALQSALQQVLAKRTTSKTKKDEKTVRPNDPVAPSPAPAHQTDTAPATTDTTDAPKEKKQQQPERSSASAAEVPDIVLRKILRDE